MQHQTKKSVPKKDAKAISPAKQNAGENLHLSRCMIEFILDDLATNYRGVGGGGISLIKATSSTSYIVSLPQEERIDQLAYEFDVKADGTLSLKSKDASIQRVGSKFAGDTPAKK